jgi:single-strand DNA-binding protein
MNQTTIGGHLGADPEVRFTSSGQKVTTLRVATRAGKEETIWWKVTLWGDQFDKMVSYLKKGSAVMCTGELNKPEIFTDREGKPQISVSLTAWHVGFSPFGKTQGQASQESNANASMMAETAVGQSKVEANFSDEEIPF